MNDDLHMMGLALDEAKFALDAGCLPVGAVVAMGGKVLGRDHKHMTSNHLDHAEMNVLRQIFRGDYTFSRADNLTLYTTLEPCVMCWGTLLHLPIRRLVYAMPDAYGGCASVDRGGLPPRHQTRPLKVISGVRQAEASALFYEFLTETKDPFWLEGGAPQFVTAVCDFHLNGGDQ